MKASQYVRIGKLLTRKSGATAMEIASVVGSTSPHKRISELKARGWLVWREAIAGRNYGRYFGKFQG